MSTEVDRKILELQCNNRDFERNIAKSKKSLDDFKESLNFDETSKGLSKFASSLEGINFSGLARNVEALAEKFTGLGNVGVYAVGRIRNELESAMLKTEQFLKSFTTAQISVGQGKYDALNKAAQALIATGKYTEEQAYSVFERVMAYTDQTSANFQTMVDQISTFVATGKGLQSSERAMEGIFNMTSKAGKGATEASSAMMVFSKAMGAGYLSLDNWQSLNQTSHIVTEDFRKQILEAAVATGDLIKKNDKYYINSKKHGNEEIKISKKKKLSKEEEAKQQEAALAKMEVTADNLENTLSKKWLSKDSMMALFDKYYFAELDPGASAKIMDKLSKAAENGVLTYEDFVDLTKDSGAAATDFRKRVLAAAVATGELTEKNGKYYTSAKKNGKQVEVTADNIEKILGTKWIKKDTIASILNDYKFAEVAYKSAQRALTFADAMNAVKESVSSGWMTSFRLIFGDVTEAMELFTHLCERVIESIYGLQEARNKILESWANNGGRSALIDAVLGDYGKEIETGAYGLLDLFDDVGKIISDGFWNMVKIFASGDEQYNWDQAGFKEAWLGLKLRDISEGIRDFIASVKGFFTEEVKVGDGTTTRLEMIKGIVDGIGGALVIAGKIVAGVMYFVGQLTKKLQPSTDAITNFLSEIGTMIYDTADKENKQGGIKKFFDDLLVTLTPLIDATNKFTTVFFDMLLAFITWGKESGVFAAIGKALGSVVQFIAGVIERGGTPIVEFLGNMFEILKELFQNGFSAESIAAVGEKVKQALTDMFNGIFGTGALEKAGAFLKSAFEKVLKDLFGIESIEAAGKAISDGFNGIYDELMKSAPDGVKKVLEKIKDLSGLWNVDPDDKRTIFARILDFLKSGFNAVVSFFKNLPNLFASDAEAADSLKEVSASVVGIVNGSTLGPEAEHAFGNIRDTLGKIADWFKNINLTKIVYSVLGALAIWKVIGLIKTMRKGIKSFFKVFGGVGEKAGGIFESISDLIDTASGSMKEIQKKLKAEKRALYGKMFLEIAIGLALLVQSVIALTKIDPMDLVKGGIALVAIMGAMWLLVKALDGSKKGEGEEEGKKASKSMLGLAVAILGIGIAVGRIAKAVEPFTKMNLEEFGKAMGATVVILGMLALVMLAVSKGDNSNFKGAALFGAAIAAIIAAMLPFAAMPLPNLIKALASVVIVMGSLAVLLALIKKMKITSAQLEGVAELADAVSKLALSLVPLSVLSWEGIAKGLVAMLGIMAMLVLFAGALKLFKINSVELAGAVGLAATIAILALTLIPLALIPAKALDKALKGILGILLMLGVYTVLISKLGGTGIKLAGAIGLALSIFILAMALIPLALIPKALLTKSLVALSVMIGALSLFAVTAKSFSVSGMIGIVLIIGMVIAIVYAFKQLGTIDGSGMLEFAISLGVILLALGASLAIMSKLPLLASLKAIITLGLVIGALVGVLWVVAPLFGKIREAMSGVNGDVLVSFASALAIIVLAVATSIAVLSAVPLIAGLKAIIVLGLAVTAIAGVMSIIIPMLLGSLGSSLAEFSAKLLLIADIIQKFSTMMNMVDDSGIGKAETVFDRLKTLMAKLTTLGDYAKEINNFSTALFDLGTGLEIFHNHTKDLPDSTNSNAFKMIDTFISYASKIKDLSFGNFSTEIFKLGVGLYAFDYLGTSMNDVSDSQPLALLKELSGCADDIKTLSTIGLDGLKGQLAGLGGAMMLYAEGANEITGIEGNQAGNIQSAMGILRAITQAFIDEGGFTLPDIPKEAELGSFGADLAALAGAIAKFANASNGLGAGTDKAIMLLDFLGGDLKTKLIKDNLEVTKVFGDASISENILTEFSADIIALGTALASFVDSTKDVDESKLTNAINALDSFAKIREHLVQQDAVVACINFFTNNSIQQSQLTAFGKDIEALGLALKAFATSVTWDENTQGSFQNAIDAIGFLAELETKLPTIGGVVGLIKGEQQDLGDLAAQIVLLGSAMEQFNNSIVDEKGNCKLNFTAMDQAIQFLSPITTYLSRLQKEMAPVGGVIALFTGEEYNAANLKTDMENFSKVIDEVINISDKLNGNSEDDVIPDKTLLDSAITALTNITTFLSDLSGKMPPKIINPLLKLFTGEAYNSANLVTDITNFKSVVDILVGIATTLNNGDEEHPMLDAEKIEPAISAIGSVTDFIKKLALEMPKPNPWLDFFTGKAYDTEKLLADIDHFKTAVSEMITIVDMLNGNDEKNPMLDPSMLEPALSTLTVFTDFVADLAEKLPHDGGFLELFTGKPYGLKNLKSDINHFKSVIKQLYEVQQMLTGNDKEHQIPTTAQIQPALDAIDTIVDFEKKLGEKMGNVGGLIGDIKMAVAGKPYDIEQLKKELGDFKTVCRSLSSISKVLNGTGPNSVKIEESGMQTAEQSIDQIHLFAEKLKEKMPSVGGLLPDIQKAFNGKEFSLDNLQEELGTFDSICRLLASFSATLMSTDDEGNSAIITSEQLSPVLGALDAILTFSSSLSEKMEKVGGFIPTLQSAITGKNYNFDSLKTELEKFGDVCSELSGFGKLITVGKDGTGSPIDEELMTSTIRILDQVIQFEQDLAVKLPSVGGITNFFEHIAHGESYSLSKLGTDLGDLGEGLGKFSTSVGKDFNADSAISAVQIASSIAGIIVDLSSIGEGGTHDVQQYITTMQDFLSSLSDDYVNDLNGDTMSSMIGSITRIAEAISEAIDMSDGIKPENIDIFEKVLDAIQKLAKTDPSFDFKPVGENISKGMAIGIESSMNLVTEAATRVAVAAYTAAMEALDAHSPSRLFMQVGDFITAGMAIGIDDGTKEVTDSITNMSGETFDSALMVLESISQLLSEDLDSNPVITPVLDLTDLSGGITDLNGMIDGKRMTIDTGVAAGITASSIPGNHAETNQNGTDYSGIYERMAALGEQITQMGNQIAKMQVVLDSGAIAGAITDRIDANIGAKAFFAGRGN